MKERDSKISASSCILVTLLIVLFISTFAAAPAFAGWGKVTVSDGAGDGVQVKHSLFGQKSFVMQDANGDEVEHKRGLFGINRETGVDVLGNETTVKHGLLRRTSVEGHDMLGDSWKSKKTFMGLGPRVTTVNAKGVHDLIGNFMHGNFPNQMMPQGPGNFGMPGNSGMPMPYPGMQMPNGGMMPERGGAGMGSPPSNFGQYQPARGFGEAEVQPNMQAPSVEPQP